MSASERLDTSGVVMATEASLADCGGVGGASIAGMQGGRLGVSNGRKTADGSEGREGVQLVGGGEIMASRSDGGYAVGLKELRGRFG